MSEVISGPPSEPVISDAESVVSSGDEELIARMDKNFEEFQVYAIVHYDKTCVTNHYLNAPDSIERGIYYQTFGGGPEGGYFVNMTDVKRFDVFLLKRTWGEKFTWESTDRKVEHQLFKDDDTFIKDSVNHIRVWKECPPPVFKIVDDFDTACSPKGYKNLSLPFFLMGAPGELSCRTSVAWLQRPKEINIAFLRRVAEKLNANPMFDWDWEGLRNNLIEPNFDHIQILHHITDPKVMARWTEDLFVFLNSANEKDTVERKRGQPNKIILAPSIKNLHNPADIDY
jgi:hypothetical protein